MAPQEKLDGAIKIFPGIMTSATVHLYAYMQSNLQFPFTSSFRVLSVRTGAGLVAACDVVVTAVRLVLVLLSVELVEKEYQFTKMSVQSSRIRYAVLFTMNTLTCLMLGAGIYMSERRPLPVLMVPWLVSYLCCIWLYYPNIIYHSRQPGVIILCVAIIVLCMYCWSVVLSHFLEVLDAVSPRRLRSVITNPPPTSNTIKLPANANKAESEQPALPVPKNSDTVRPQSN